MVESGFLLLLSEKTGFCFLSSLLIQKIETKSEKKNFITENRNRKRNEATKWGGAGGIQLMGWEFRKFRKLKSSFLTEKKRKKKKKQKRKHKKKKKRKKKKKEKRRTIIKTGGGGSLLLPSVVIDLSTSWPLGRSWSLLTNPENGPSTFWRRKEPCFLLSGQESGLPIFWVDERCFSEYH